MSKPPTTCPRLNVPIHSISQIMSNLMSLDAEAEIGAAYIKGQEAVLIRTLILELGHPQTATPIQVNNSTADGFANDTIKQKRPKAIDMRFYWICNHTSQGQLLINWQLGTTNLGDYHTKHHSPAHHQLMRPTYLHTTEQLAQCAIAHILRECVNSRVPTTVRHGSSFHIICPKPQSRPRCLPVVRRRNYRLESQTSVLRPTLKLLTRVPVDSSPRRISFDRR